MEKTLQRKLFRLIVLIGLSILMTAAVLADSGTTTGSTAYKSLSANTQMYVVTGRSYGDYKYYGALNEPKNGVYYGRVSLGGTLPDGRYGSINSEGLADESIVSQYYSLTNAYPLSYWSYLYGQYIADGSHGLLVQLNFENEADDCTAAVKGTYDTKLIADFKYLATLSCPVFVRIGGEMNVWDNRASATSFINAYRHIAMLARTYASNVALVFSVNYSSSYQVDMDSYYPGDDYVDWVGASLYFNRYTDSGVTGNDRFYGVGVYGDAMLNIQQTVNLSRLHKKPIIITECGSAHTMQGKDTSAFAAERVEKAYAFLTMVYPEIKAIVYSDTNFTTQATSYYRLTGNAVMTAAYNKGVAANRTLLHSVSDTAEYYTKVSSYTGDWGGTMTLTAYTYSSSRLTAKWYVDGTLRSTVSDYPWQFQLNAAGLTAGKHTVQVVFSNGASQSYTFTRTADGWKQLSSSWYYYENGSAVTGWKKISGKWYYFSTAGIMRTLWQKIDGRWYYLGTNGAMLTGWQKLGGKWYYLNSAMQTGWQKIDGKWYYLGTSGAMQTGWQKIDGKWYYLNSAMKTGWQKLDGKWYYLNSAMKTGWQKIDGKWYYLNSAMQTGLQQIGGRTYYLNTAMQTGWQEIDGSRRYFSGNGAMVTGEMLQDCVLYTFGDDGILISETASHTWDTGTITTEAGCETPGEILYTCTVCGETRTEELPALGHQWRDITTVPTAEEAGYTTHSCMRCGETETDTETAADTNADDGWVEKDGNLYYYIDDTALTGWIQVDGTCYYLNETGAMQTGWLTLEYGTWYLDETGAMQTGWLTLEDRQYYLDESGRRLTGSQEIDGIQYVFDDDGVLTA